MRRILSACAIAALTAPALAEPTQLFFDNFQGGRPAREWSDNVIHETSGPRVFTWFGGRFNRETIRLTLPAVQLAQDSTDPLIVPYDQGDFDGGGDDGDDGDGDDSGGGGGGGGDAFVRYTLTFDLYVLDSWDGNHAGFGPDTFQVLANTQTIFSETFANQHDDQSFREPDDGRRHMGYNNAAKDSIYRDISVDFSLSPDATTLLLDFRAVGLQTLSDESWGIDNVRVGYEIVPAPATVMPLAGLALARRRRKES